MIIAAHENPTRSRPLFEIGRDMADLEAYIESLDGDISAPGVEEKVMAWLSSLGGEQAVKLDDYINLIRKWEGEAAAARAEEDRYKKARQIREARVERFEQRLQAHLEATKQTKVETATGRTVRLQANGGPLPVLIAPGIEPRNVPTGYQRRVETIDFNKDEIREALEDGEVLPWAKLGERGVGLRIN